MEKNGILTKSLDIAQKMIENGGEISKAEETVKRINASNNQSCLIFALPTLIIAQSGSDTQIRRIKNIDTDLLMLARLNSLSRKLCNDKYAKGIEKEAGFSNGFKNICVFLATASFSLFFGGTLTDAVFSGIIGFIIYLLAFKTVSFPSFSSNLLESFIAGILSFLPKMIGFNVNQDKIIIGAIMVLVPGLTVVNAIRDLMNSELLAGLIELATAVFSALSIALGIAGALILFKML